MGRRISGGDGSAQPGSVTADGVEPNVRRHVHRLGQRPMPLGHATYEEGDLARISSTSSRLALVAERAFEHVLDQVVMSTATSAHASSAMSHGPIPDGAQ